MRVNIACVVIPRDVAFPVTAGKRERMTASFLPANTGRRSYLSFPSLILSPLWYFLLLRWKNKKSYIAQSPSAYSVSSVQQI
jgi:hypothetical protein